MALAAAGVSHLPAYTEEGGTPSASFEEHVERRWFLVPVTIEESKAPLPTAAELRVFVDGRRIDGATFDVGCRDSDSDATAEPASSPGARPFNVVFLLDEIHLSPEGRRRAYRLADELGRIAMADGGRVFVVLQRQKRQIVARRVSDPETLTKALADASGSTSGSFSIVPTAENRFATFTLEAQRMANEYAYACRRGRGALDDPDNSGRRLTDCEMRYRSRIESLVASARSFADDNLRLARTAFEGLEESTTLVADSPEPRLVIYFADLLLRNPAEPYAKYLRNDPQIQALAALASSGRAALESDRYDLLGAFDDFVNAAAGRGVRIHAISAHGLATSTLLSIGADSTLASVAAGTGGRSFLGGASDDLVRDWVRRDLACRAQIGFDPVGLPADRPLSFRVESPRRRARLTAPPRIVLPSEATRARDRLLAATLGGSDSDPTLHLGAALVPIGFERGTFEALLQLAATATERPPTSWSLGASLLSEGRVVSAIERGLAISDRIVPVVLEGIVRFPPGDVNVEAVGQDKDEDRIARDSLEGEWRIPEERGVSLTPVVLMQPSAGAFVRDGASRTEGSVAVPARAAVRLGAPVAFVSLLCGRGGNLDARVLRTVEGERGVEFPPVTASFEGSETECRQIRDVIPAGTLGPGAFRYAVRVEVDGNVAATRETPFVAGSPP